MERDLRQAFRWVCRGKALIYDSGRVPARKAPGKAPRGRCLPVEHAALPLHRENGRGEVGRSNGGRKFFPIGEEGREKRVPLRESDKTGGKGNLAGLPSWVGGKSRLVRGGDCRGGVASFSIVTSKQKGGVVCSRGLEIQQVVRYGGVVAESLTRNGTPVRVCFLIDCLQHRSNAPQERKTLWACSPRSSGETWKAV